MNVARLRFGLAASLLAFAMVAPVFAQPAIWESDFGPALADLTGEDDGTTSVVLSFIFPYDGVGFTTVWVGTNGCVQLGTLGTDENIDYDHWSYFEEFVDDGGAPELCAFNADLNLEETGTIHFHDFGDRAVFTWNEVGTYQSPDVPLSFQIQMEASGRVVFGYNGMFDGVDEDPLDDLDTGIVVGITSSDGVNPGPSDLTNSPFPAGGTTYQAWCYDEANSCGYSSTEMKLAKVDGVKPPAAPQGGPSIPGPTNSSFDLDQSNVIFEPGLAQSVVEVPALGRKGLAAFAALLALAAFAVRRRA